MFVNGSSRTFSHVPREWWPSAAIQCVFFMTPDPTITMSRQPCKSTRTHVKCGPSWKCCAYAALHSAITFGLLFFSTLSFFFSRSKVLNKTQHVPHKTWHAIVESKNNVLYTRNQFNEILNKWNAVGAKCAAHSSRSHSFKSSKSVESFYLHITFSSTMFESPSPSTLEAVHV